MPLTSGTTIPGPGHNRGKAGNLRRSKQNGLPKPSPIDHSDETLVALLKRIKASSDPAEIRRLTKSAERIIFHKQHQRA